RAQDSYPPVGGHGFNSRLRYKKALTQQLELFLFWSAGIISASWRTRVQFPSPLQESSNSTVGAFSFLERRNHIRQLADTGSIPVPATRKLQLNSWSFFFLERRNHIRQLADTGSTPVSATRRGCLKSLVKIDVFQSN